MTDDASTAIAPRTLLLGKVVNLREHRAERTLTEKPPSVELDDGRLAFFVDREATLRGYTMADGAQLWSRRPEATCQSLVDGDGVVFCVAEHRVTGYAKPNGAVPDVYRTSSTVTNAERVGARIAVYELDGRVTLLDAASGGILASKVVTSECAFADKRYCATRFFDAEDFAVICAKYGSPLECYDRALELKRSNVSWRPGEYLGDFNRHHLVVRHETFVNTISKSEVRDVYSRVVRLADGAVAAETSGAVLATIEKADGSLDGLVMEDGVHEPSGTLRWKAELPGRGQFVPLYSEVVRGPRQIIFRNDPPAAGPIAGLDPASGAWWSAEPPILFFRPSDERPHGLQFELVRVEVRDEIVIVDAVPSPGVNPKDKLPDLRNGALLDARTGRTLYVDLGR